MILLQQQQLQQQREQWQVILKPSLFLFLHSHNGHYCAKLGVQSALKKRMRKEERKKKVRGEKIR